MFCVVAVVFFVLFLFLNNVNNRETENYLLYPIMGKAKIIKIQSKHPDQYKTNIKKN